MSVLTTAPSPHRYAERTPYFLEAKRLRALVEDHERTMRRMRAQREAELEAINGRNALINKTLGAWNRALGNASAQVCCCLDGERLACMCSPRRSEPRSRQRVRAGRC